MNKKEQNMLAALQKQTKMHLDSLTRETSMNKASTKKLSKLWKNKLLNFKGTMVHNQLMSYQRSLTRQMDFKDKLIEKLLNELKEFEEHRKRASLDNLELVNNTLSSFKKEIEEIHDHYQVEVKGALPDDLAEIELRINENDNFWRVIKYDDKAIDIQTQNKNIEIKNKYLEKMNLENGRFESIIEKFRDMFNYKSIKESYISVVEEYKKKTEQLRADYSTFFEQDENLTITQKQINGRIKDLTNKISDLEIKINDPASANEVNILTKERDELHKSLIKFIKKVENHSERGQKQLSRLCVVTKPIQTEMKTILDKGNDLMRCIRLCQKLETPEDKANGFVACNEPAEGNGQAEFDAILGIPPEFFNRVTYVIQCSKLIDEENKKLQRDNEVLKKKMNTYLSRLKKKVYL